MGKPKTSSAVRQEVVATEKAASAITVHVAREQFLELIELQKGKDKKRRVDLDRLLKATQLVTVIILGVWGLVMYGSFQRENNRLVNEKLKADLRIAGFDIENKGQTRFGRAPTCKISTLSGTAPNRRFLVEFNILLKNNADKPFTIFRNAMVFSIAKVKDESPSSQPVQRQAAIGEKAGPEGALAWSRMYAEANLFNFSATAAMRPKLVDVLDIKATGRDGTGRLPGGQTLAWSFSFVVKEPDAQWVGFATYFELDEGQNPEDKAWRIDRFPLREGVFTD